MALRLGKSPYDVGLLREDRAEREVDTKSLLVAEAPRNRAARARVNQRNLDSLYTGAILVATNSNSRPALIRDLIGQLHSV